VLEERDRLAREIHDGVAQIPASMPVRLDTIERLAERGLVDELGSEVAALRLASGEAYADVRWPSRGMVRGEAPISRAMAARILDEFSRVLALR
jgi:signal transduction histidine kinase